MDYSGFETGCALSLFLLGEKLHRKGARQEQEQIQKLLMQLVYLMQGRSDKQCKWAEVHAFCSLGSLNLLSGFREHAANCYRNAIDILVSLVGPESPDVADTLRQLSMCESDIDQIRKLSDQARIIEQKTEHTSPLESVIKSMESTGINLPEELKAFAGIASEAKQENLNPVNDHKLAEKPLPNVISPYLSDEDYYKQLLSLLSDALVIAKQSFTESWSDKWSTTADLYWGTTFALLKSITSCQRKIGALSEAISGWQEIISILEDTRGQDNVFLRKALLHVSEVYQELGQIDLAEQNRSRAMAIGSSSSFDS